MITNRKEKNIAMSETYLDIKLYTIVRQISSFFSDVAISFSGGELTPAELVGILSHSYKFNNTYKNSTRHYEVKKMTKLDFIKDNVDNIFKCQQEIKDIFQDSYTDFNKINSAEQRIDELNDTINILCQSIEDALNAEYYHHLPRKFIIFKKYFKVFMMSSIILIECPQDPNNLDWAFCIAQIKEYLRHDDFYYTVFETYGCTYNFCIKNQPKGVDEGKLKEKVE